ncbi:MAG: hypothetical protein R3293_24765 [Candidatus Promineifilaceae bacterium]|nr:hypothetical protein [Candidatus Promineifilaceae bacterium]
MPIFNFKFTVDAALADVVDFHYQSNVKSLTPPPIIVQLHKYEPLGEGSLADFTMWLGPLPLRWKVVHSDVSQEGFTDTQLEGPLQRWQHQHRFTALDKSTTEVSEHIEYAYKPGLFGLFSRLLFSAPALTFLFTARKMITRRKVRQRVSSYA